MLPLLIENVWNEMQDFGVNYPHSFPGPYVMFQYTFHENLEPSRKEPIPDHFSKSIIFLK